MRIQLDPYRTSVMAVSAISRIAAVSFLLTCLWIAIGWAVALP
jgi:hypothetical protein